MSERWAQEFELRARALWTDEAVHRVTEGKDVPILPSNAPTLLRALGLLHRDASMPPPQVRKFLQLYQDPPVDHGLKERLDSLSRQPAGEE